MEAVLHPPVSYQEKYEIERGKPMPSKNHSIVQSNLNGLFYVHFRKQYRFMSEINILLQEKVKVPVPITIGIAIYPKMDFVASEDIIKMSDIPLGVIEILSPTQSLTELIVKSKVYFENGIKSYWLVLPELQTVYVFSSINEYEAFVKKGRLKDEVLGIELEVEQIFE